jgi:hypothetical protein
MDVNRRPQVRKHQNDLSLNNLNKISINKRDYDALHKFTPPASTGMAAIHHEKTYGYNDVNGKLVIRVKPYQ